MLILDNPGERHHIRRCHMYRIPCCLARLRSHPLGCSGNSAVLWEEPGCHPLRRCHIHAPHRLSTHPHPYSLGRRGNSARVWCEEKGVDWLFPSSLWGGPTIAWEEPGVGDWAGASCHPLALPRLPPPLEFLSLWRLPW